MVTRTASHIFSRFQIFFLNASLKVLTIHGVVGASVSPKLSLSNAAAVGLDEPPYPEVPSPAVGIAVVAVGDAV